MATVGSNSHMAYPVRPDNARQCFWIVTRTLPLANAAAESSRLDNSPGNTDNQILGTRSLTRVSILVRLARYLPPPPPPTHPARSVASRIHVARICIPTSPITIPSICTESANVSRCARIISGPLNYTEPRVSPSPPAPLSLVPQRGMFVFWKWKSIARAYKDLLKSH